MKAHFVTYLSPGTFFNEQSCLPITSWDVAKAMKMAERVTERYNATPFAFYFETRSRTAKQLDSKVSATSPKYYLGGKVETLAEVAARNLPEEQILVDNMRGNNWDRIITNTNSCKVTQPLNADDVVLDWVPPAKLAA